MHILTISALLILLFVAAWQDFHSYRIRNTLVVSGTLLGFLVSVFLPEGIGLSESVMGWVTGLLLLLPFYLLHVMAAGDVKLMAMVGAFLGPQVMVGILLYVLIAGGVLALAMAWYRGILPELFHNLMKISLMNSFRNSPSVSSSKQVVANAKTKLPYGVAIAAGTLFFLVSHHNGF